MYSIYQLCPRLRPNEIQIRTNFSTQQYGNVWMGVSDLGRFYTIEATHFELVFN